MTAKQILDSFSETLMRDERILSPQERELLMSLLQNSRAVSSSDPQTQSAVTAAIARSVGETVAQRAFTLLGSSIVEQILARSGMPAGTEETLFAATVEARAPQPPNPVKAPQPPNPVKAPQPPNPAPAPGPKAPQPPNPTPPPGPKAPQPPNPSRPTAPQPPNALHPQHDPRPLSVPVQQAGEPSHVDASSSVGVLDLPEMVRAQCVALDEFLAPQELEELVSYTLQREAEFQSSELVSPSGEPGMIDYDHRRSRVLMDLGKHEEIILDRIRGVLPRVLDQLGIEQFPVTQVEAQITASNDGDFFRAHSDDSEEVIASRRLTFVYFFHSEPRPFEGGELRLHDSRREGGLQISSGTYQTVVPQQNQIVFFPCSLLHEITPVECRSRAFADSRFTLNGWLHK
ncbi:MAG: 2OG-Fe(II) oxygenase [Candidatus Sulfotelmatobacter sp.]|jgi:Rps23 Pro-64 3,4-dihydroxylase Tpa1-like proline 4-hydroxylase